jgi:FlaG/FlaF family flagellin (archaellin)
MTRKRKNRAVAPVIATLMMVAIAVVGGTIIFVFAQGFFNTGQISSGAPSIEYITVLGYDARDVSKLTTHDGLQTFKPYSGGDGDGLYEKNERIAIYVQNNSPQTITIDEISFGGTVYEYANAEGLQSVGEDSSIRGGEYDFWLGKGEENHDVMLQEGIGVLEPGDSVTTILALDSNFKAGRDIQFKMTTTNGAIFVSTVVMGQNMG